MPEARNDRLFQAVNHGFLTLVSLSMLLPFVHLAAVSLSSPMYVTANMVVFWPRGFHLAVYRDVFGLAAMWRSMAVSAYITVAGTLLALALNSSLAYALSRPAMKGRKYVLQGVLVTFIFSVPLIPSFLVVRSLGMYDTLWALIVPGALAAFNVILMKTFFQSLSSELFDAAKIDGCGEFAVYWRLTVPLSKAVFATIALFHAVGQWNSYFSAIIFIKRRTLLPLQVVLREMIVDDQFSSAMSGNMEVAALSTPAMMKAGIIVVGTLPILIVYPFLQRYFVQGAMLGSLKE
ncbi:MAG: carbohydrate ABC transporter permease [Paenibacillaceae bacterium]|nr:carbohydrate ABC transporter permease [Paenibacillaceae bacterium]